jgi:putative ABC transport system permease protein
LQTILMFIGITLGVAVVVAIDLANASASQAFDLSTEAVTGKATHQITGGPNRLNESLYTQLRREGFVEPIAPIVTDYVSSPQLGGQTLQLLGVDPFAEPPFRDYLDDKNAIPIEQITSFLTQPGAVYLSKELADQFGYGECSTSSQENNPSNPDCAITIEFGGHNRRAFIAGTLDPKDQLTRRAVENLLLADISTAQELTGRRGLIDRIDLILEKPCGEPATKNNCETSDEIQELIPPDAKLQTVTARSGAIEQMTVAFRLNLTALSLLALVVGMFLIYNTMTFSVVQRRQHFGTLRCLGVTKREIFSFVIGEALVVGILGSIFGAILGIFMGQGAVRLVTQTINDLFFVLTVQGIQIPTESLMKGGLLGVTATILSTIPPAWEAASVPPRMALLRSNLESKVGRVVKFAALIGILFIVVGGTALLLPSQNLVLSFSATFSIIVGFAFITPQTSKWFMQVTSSFTGKLYGSLGRIAPRDVITSLSRTGVAVAALMVAISVTIGVSLMVNSFRHTVIIWLEQTLQGDIYISAPGISATQPSTAIDPQITQIVKNWPGVRRVDVLRSVTVDSPNGLVHIAATDNPDISGERIFLSKQGSLEEIAQAMQAGAILISEPFANRLGIASTGEKITLTTLTGPEEFPIVGIYYDYASTQGTVLMKLDTYRSYWKDNTVTAMALRLDQGFEADPIATNIRERVEAIQRLDIRPNRVLREEVLVVFDRTFTITGALQLLATVVAFVGVLSAMLSLQLERQREMGILRAIGMTTRQLWNLMMIETGLMGVCAGLFAMPVGLSLAAILIYIINRRSFGWTLLMQIDPVPFLQALIIALLSALLAGIYPALKISRAPAADALRSE